MRISESTEREILPIVCAADKGMGEGEPDAELVARDKKRKEMGFLLTKKPSIMQSI